MNRKAFFLIILFFALTTLFLSCSRPLLDQNLLFGIQAAQRDLWDEAIFRWKKVVQLNPNSAAAHNNLAVAYEKKGLWEEAKEEYELAVKLGPENSYIKSNYKNFKDNYPSEKKEKDEKN